jgi:translation elongation factor EF-4
MNLDKKPFIELWELVIIMIIIFTVSIIMLVNAQDNEFIEVKNPNSLEAYRDIAYSTTPIVSMEGLLISEDFQIVTCPVTVTGAAELEALKKENAELKTKVGILESIIEGFSKLFLLMRGKC